MSTPANQRAALTVAPARQGPQAETKPIAEPTNPNGIEPTIAPTPVDKRYFVAPGDVLTGGFSTTRIGINPLTGKPWGAAA